MSDQQLNQADRPPPGAKPKSHGRLWLVAGGGLLIGALAGLAGGISWQTEASNAVLSPCLLAATGVEWVIEDAEEAFDTIDVSLEEVDYVSRQLDRAWRNADYEALKGGINDLSMISTDYQWNPESHLRQMHNCHDAVLE